MEPRKSIRWLKTSALNEELFRDFQEQLRKAPYAEKSGIGFLADKLTAQQIEATYIERKLRKSEIAGPLGNVQRLEWFEFTTYAFTFDRRRRIIEVDSSARSLAPLIQQFGILAAWKASFEPFVLEPTKLLDFLRKEHVRFDVTRLQADGVTLSTNSAASLDVTGQGSVLKDLEKLLGPRKCTVARLTIVVSEPSKRFRIDVSQTGKVTTDYATYDDAIALCGKAIAWLQSK